MRAWIFGIAVALSVPVLWSPGAAGAGESVSAGELPGWLSGEWHQQLGDRWTEEFWTPPRGGIMIGAGRTGRGDTLGSWESMRIVKGADGTLTFYGAPQGGQAVAFPLVSQTETEVVFANPQHDYPQRIRYWRVDGALHAEVALADGSKAMAWTYARIGG